MNSIKKPHELPGNIFMQPWWLDIVTDGKWEDTIVEKGGEIKARWPIPISRIGGLVYVEMPILTQKGGPWIKQTSTKQETRHRNERSTLEILIKKLPKVDSFNYTLSSKIVNYLPFSWAGYSQKSITTYRLEFPFDLETIWDEMNSSVRRDIRRAKESLKIVEISPDILYQLIQNTFKRKDKNLRYSINLFKKLCEEALNRGRATLIGASDDDGHIHAGILLIHDDDATYYLAGGIDSHSNYPGAASLCLWSGFNIARELENTFDFEGSSVKSIERFFSSFGSKPIHLHNIQKVSKRYYPIKLAKDIKKEILRA